MAEKTGGLVLATVGCDQYPSDPAGDLPRRARPRGAAVRRLAVVALLAAAAPAAAQERWQVSVSPYVWVPSLTNTLETAFGDVSSSLSRSDVLGDLDFALMGVLDARRGRLTLALDLIYSDLSTERGAPLGPLFGAAKVGMSLTALTGYAGWRLHEDERVSFDLLGGLRHFRLDNTLTLTQGLLDRRDYDYDDDWTVPVLGARSVVRFDGGWFGTLTADLGSWDGDYTWQGIATLGRRLGENWSVQGGWRYMEFDRSVDGADLKVELNGPLLGATYRF